MLVSRPLPLPLLEIPSNKINLLHIRQPFNNKSERLNFKNQGGGELRLKVKVKGGGGGGQFVSICSDFFLGGLKKSFCYQVCSCAYLQFTRSANNLNIRFQSIYFFLPFLHPTMKEPMSLFSHPEIPPYFSDTTSLSSPPWLMFPFLNIFAILFKYICTCLPGR